MEVSAALEVGAGGQKEEEEAEGLGREAVGLEGVVGEG